MNTRYQARIFLAVLFSASLILYTSVSHWVQARELTDLNALADGQTIDNDVFIAWQQVTIDGTVNGDVFVLGNQVAVNGDINGSLFVLGQSVDIQGKVSGTTYAAAILLKMGSTALLQRNLYYVGAVFTAQDGAQIQRDLNTICLDAKISGQIGRSTNALIGIIHLIQYLIQSLSGVIDFPEWMLQPIGYSPILVGGGLANNLLMACLLQIPFPNGGIDTQALGKWGLDLLRQFGLLLVLGLIVTWLLQKPLAHSAKALRSRSFVSLGYGLVALFIIGNVFLAALLVASLVFVLGLWIGFLGLWDFTLALWLFSFAALGVFLALLWMLVAYGSKLIVAYLVGSWLFEKLTPKADLPRFLALVVGILIYTLLRSIPMLGWVISVLVIAWGLGAAWLAYRAGAFRESTSIVTMEAETSVNTTDQPQPLPAAQTRSKKK